MPSSSNPKKDAVNVEPSKALGKRIRRPFPGPRGATAALRVAVDRNAQGDIVGHAQSALTTEVCGVLVGQIGEDDEGDYVHVEAIIRGNAATEASTHVTFTQATWDEIHQTLERDHPKQRIVGWYHTHPGFGVEFSEMDVFIQRNFFSAPTQVALVMDPTAGIVALAINAATGVEYLPRYWVDGREHTAKVPPGATKPEGASAAAVTPGDLGQLVKSLESRVGQLIQIQDDQRAFIHQIMLTVGMVFCAAIVGLAAYFVISSYRSHYEPPTVNSFVPIPVKVGDKTVLLGVGIVEWNVPPELNALLLEMEQRKADAAAKAEAAAKAAEAKATADPKAPADTKVPPDAKPADTKATSPAAAPPKTDPSHERK